MRDLHLPRLFKPRSRGLSSMTLVVFCAALLTVGAVFFLWQRYQYIRLGFAVTELRQRKAVLQGEIEPLEFEVEYLSRLERIETLATERLGMRPPRTSQVRRLNRHDTSQFSSK
ncbi:MAG: cell division protein FtsL [SAR324 cluster bacterium]|nr:cell division protein FtsL [SAR324 cluster bacterium]MCZ6645082.1 cell division protein FtsL [SAR324 cluster bacterium]MCZ6841714.1 cell division protein FtsL [SAR324 cluster bacterium]